VGAASVRGLRDAMMMMVGSGNITPAWGGHGLDLGKGSNCTA